MAGLPTASEPIEEQRAHETASRDEVPVVVRVDDVSVCLSLQREKVTSLREHAIRFLQRRPVETEEFWPVRNASFEVRRGEAFGIIGRNGAGKSTLLKTVAGVLAPTRGRVDVYGRIAPLLELGAGFDPEMTGRENVFLYGSLLGFPRRKLVERFDHIVRFAELEDFIDVPLKNYSSGMAARLGFAVATDVDADVLIVDEALTVGDSRFQLKCMERIDDFRRRGMAILFVSHNTAQVRELCSRALWIDNGEVRACGEVDRVLSAYATHEFDPGTPSANGRAPVRVEPAGSGAISTASADEIRTRIGAGGYDFIDVNAVDVNSAIYCRQRFDGVGVGIAKSAKLADGYRAIGVDAIEADPTRVELPENCVGFVSLMDSLHFFTEPGAVEALLERAARWARDFIFVRIPSFEDDTYLRALGLKFFWCDWTTIPDHCRVDHLTATLHALNLNQYNFLMRQPVLSSDSAKILPADAPPDQGPYELELHGAKPAISFPRPIYAQIDLFVALRAFDPDEWRRIVTFPW